jgi:hypothetical protein
MGDDIVQHNLDSLVHAWASEHGGEVRQVRAPEEGYEITFAQKASVLPFIGVYRHAGEQVLVQPGSFSIVSETEAPVLQATGPLYTRSYEELFDTLNQLKRYV